MPGLILLLFVAARTLGRGRPQLEPGHAIRVTAVSSGPRQIGPCVVLGSRCLAHKVIADHDVLPLHGT